MSGPEAAPAENDIAVLARIDMDLHQRLKEQARRNDRSMAAEIRQALREHLSELEEAA